MQRLYDLLAFCYFAGLLTLAVFFYPAEFKTLTTTHPFAMGFIKLALLATFGEYLKKRMIHGRWTGDRGGVFLFRVLVWGCFGFWFTAVFPLFAHGVQSLIQTGLWPEGPAFWVAFSCSLWINLLGCYGWTMMLVHEWANVSIAAGHPVSLPVFAGIVDKNIWFGRIPWSILIFWLPAHTITFALPGEWRILMAASLSVVLGFLLTAGSKTRK